MLALRIWIICSERRCAWVSLHGSCRTTPQGRYLARLVKQPTMAAGVIPQSRAPGPGEPGEPCVEDEAVGQAFALPGEVTETEAELPASGSGCDPGPAVCDSSEAHQEQPERLEEVAMMDASGASQCGLQGCEEGLPASAEMQVQDPPEAGQIAGTGEHGDFAAAHLALSQMLALLREALAESPAPSPRPAASCPDHITSTAEPAH
ncbi:unnamed protein product [Effrenium voratum]|uniref:Uncharacterized protein n=1 Tax=Effrenium voratum TaxID=2562239 RepID=A0AA36JI30_9DINO|nr:unnamed protein product [Effrenium voratum]CAJ1419840.1 unnamed protein product [Effrenium voratum]